MIAWMGVSGGGLLVLGLAIILAALSHASWRCTETSESPWQVLNSPAFSAPSSLGLALVGTGLFLIAASPLVKALWALLTTLWVGHGLARWREDHSPFIGGKRYPTRGFHDEQLNSERRVTGQDQGSKS